ncbi:nuclear transport factor 2 family protein [Blastococcus sp. TF02A-35]|uniref:nuclear transport factor 2 family protein n=1 Tax=Blastococcus sp. TF02A-35 TaxID=2559612 RepID=UPI001073C76D|nr:nuclear transport factor 2 family protein [Blastococcus sp. TF02A_35]TFV46538.1 nuclear transport factor 2 family protein [Blastococcus sp. TF02A_35]
MDEGVQAAIDGEMALLEPEVRSSRARAERLLDEEFVEFGSSGQMWDRESMLEAMAGTLSAAGEPIEPFGVRGVRLAENLVHVTYMTNWRGWDCCTDR